MERRVRLPEGELAYIWTRKRVKNWNLRVSPDGTVTLSTPTGVTGAEADRYVIGKAAWIDASRRRLAGRNRLTLNAALVLAPPDCAAYVVIHELCHRIHPDHSAAFHRLVARVLARAGLPDEASLRRQLRGSDAAAWIR